LEQKVCQQVGDIVSSERNCSVARLPLMWRLAVNPVCHDAALRTAAAQRER